MFFIRVLHEPTIKIGFKTQIKSPEKIIPAEACPTRLSREKFAGIHNPTLVALEEARCEWGADSLVECAVQPGHMHECQLHGRNLLLMSWQA